jgi:hypothetical protein
MRWARFSLPAIVVAAAALAGCQQAPPQPLAPVKGQVIYRDKPVKMATVQLVPDGAKGTHAPSANGQTDSDGSFTIQTPPYGSGAIPGHYHVTVLSYATNPFLPGKYASPASTPLKIQVLETGDERLVLTLKD